MSARAQAGDPSVLTCVAITFATADGGTQHTPLVLGRLGGVVTRLVLDTGSDVHLLNRELVDRIGLGVEEGEEGTDHSGATIPSWSVEDVVLELGELATTLRDVVAIPAPKPFPGWGVGGILSPHHLHPSAWTVIDLVRDELLLVEGTTAALAAWLSKRSPALRTLELPRDEAFASVVVPAAISPHPELPMLLNTGGKHTEFSAAAVPGVHGAAGERLGDGVSGEATLGSKAGPATLLVAGHDLPVPVLAVREVMHDPQGMVGMDVLPGTILAVGADRSRPVLWQLP